MPAVKCGWMLAALMAAAAPAFAVGMGPLAKSGLTDGPRKAFYLTVINPYPAAASFKAYAVGVDDEEVQSRVRILPEATIRIGAKQNRRILVVADDLEPGETFAFRVCAAKAEMVEGMVHARVCSKLSARRIAPRA
ncbi:hypothetical protein IC614_01235 [Allosphingosinicella flava]|uniref:Uncharacterized protein n=1 Tax=Allosphingosinicella flava TaxID=2771430 RepID=A0A7T2LM84_9SPHN|nr:hypothetical protein [Sphingosinicella flava]QPQ55271.1 hypothetical protein IC614_01235 [Sphingosinicella flava]